MSKLKRYIKAKYFFDDYTSIKNHTNKMQGKSGRGKPLDFTPQDKSQIIQALQKMSDDLINDIKNEKK